MPTTIPIGRKSHRKSSHQSSNSPIPPQATGPEIIVPMTDQAVPQPWPMPDQASPGGVMGRAIISAEVRAPRGSEGTGPAPDPAGSTGWTEGSGGACENFHKQTIQSVAKPRQP